MKYCPACRCCFEDASSFCHRDQVELISAYAGPRAISHQYSVDRLIGEGVTGNVYAGKRLETDRPVALKLLLPPFIGDPDAGKLFRREALAIAHLNTRINHQHVAQTIDYGQTPDGIPYVVMEMVAGISLGERLRGAEDIPLHFAVSTARQVADGLWAAHRCGVTHRSLNPSNILLTQRYDGQYDAKILNFGFSKLRKQPAPDEHLLAYQAPEQRAGQEPDARSDIYALGVLLYQMLTDDADDLELIAAWSGQVAGEPLFLARLPEQLPPSLRQLLGRALRKNPAERPNSAADMARELTAVEETFKSGAAAEAAVQDSPTAAPERLPLSVVHAAFVKSGLAVSGSPVDFVSNGNGAEDSGAEVADAPQIETARLESSVRQTAPTFEERGEREPEAPILATRLQDELVEPEPEKVSAWLDSGSESEPRAPRRRPRLVYAASAALALAVIAVVYAQWPQTVPAAAGQASREAFDAQAVAPPVAAKVENSTPSGAGDVSPVSDVSSPPDPGNEEALPQTEQTSFKEVKAIATATPAVPENKQPPAASAKTPDAAPQDVVHAPGGEKEVPAAPQKTGGAARCDVTTSVDQVNLAAGTAALITVAVNGDVNATHIRPTTKDWANIVVFPESRPGQGDNSAKFSIVSVSKRKGDYSVNFKTPCGSRDLAVKVNEK